MKFHREQIVSAARRLFVQKGVPETSMDDIAAEAEYSKSTIYVYFSGKEEIRYYIVLEEMRRLYGGVSESMRRKTDLRGRFFDLCWRMVALSDEDPLFLDSLLEKIGVDDQEFKRTPVLGEIYKTGEQINRMIERMLAEAVENGETAGTDPPARTGFALWCAICGLISVSANKEAYLQKDFGMDRAGFLQSGFDLLLRSVTIRTRA